MAISITKPTVGASQDTWGTTLNAALDTLEAAANGSAGYSAPNLEANNWKIQDVAVTATGNELNLLSGALGNTVVADKAAVYGPAGELAATTLNVGTVDLGTFTITETGGNLFFAVNGTNVGKLDASGNLIVIGNITAYGTI